MKPLLCLQILLGSLLCIPANAFCASSDKINVPVSTGDEILVEQFPASGKYLMLWFAPEYGLRENHRALAEKLSKQNIEVWLCNLLDSLFLPAGTNAIKELDSRYPAEIIAYAHKLTGKKIILAGDSYAAVLALRGAQRWQQSRPTDPYLIGAVLFSPYVYSSIPQLGQLPEYLPIASATNIPIMIYQAQHSAIIGQYDTLLAKLQQHGNPIYSRFMPDIMSLFYQQEPTIYMQQQTKPLPVHIRKVITLLENHKVPANAIPLKQASPKPTGIDIQLKLFQGDLAPVSLELPDINGNLVTKRNYKGKVTVINFWATWCPPCIQEIPSLNRLKNKMQGLPFELISINYAEDRQAVMKFMKNVHVEFPVLLDQHGEFATQWRVISYPSTFVIDSKGNIKYGVNAAIEWDNPEIIEQIKSLI